MADGLNSVHLLGNLAGDSELRMTNSGQAVLKFRMATSESYLDRNQERQERTEWHSVVMWGKRAESLAQYLLNGAKVFIGGKLHTSSWEAKDGTKRYRTEVVAGAVILCGSAGKGSRAPMGEAKPTGGGGFSDADYAQDDDDIPF